MAKKRLRTLARVGGVGSASAILGLAGVLTAGQYAGANERPANAGLDSISTSTPIKHVVVIFQENVSFDHYFGTYPNALNIPGEPAFHAFSKTPSVNGLSAELLTNNPNLSDPQRLNASQAHTCDQNHDYTAEQMAFDKGLMDKFVQYTGAGLTLQQCLAAVGNTAPVGGTDPNHAAMDYFDGNTVTGLWNYAQHFALSDNSYGTTFGPSSPGAVNVTAGNTYGAICGPTNAVYQAPPCVGTPLPSEKALIQPKASQSQGPGTMYSDADPFYDVCSNGAASGGKYNAAKDIKMGGQNIGNLLDSSKVTWGWFEGGFASPGYVPGRPSTDNLASVCSSTHKNIAGQTVADYIPHHEPFQFYASTSNPQHLPPTSISAIGRQDQANHQYDIKDFWAAADVGDMPAVSYLKAPAYQDGHAGYSDPTDEQHFLAQTINHLQQLPSWKSTAVIINWDDSDGWYDHQMGPIVRQSQTLLDGLTGPDTCGTNLSKVPLTSADTPEQGRCGVGPRIPLLVISPYAKANFVDHSFTTQTSIVKFIEDNWLAGRRIGGGSADATTGSLLQMFDFSRPRAAKLMLDPLTGQVASARRGSSSRGFRTDNRSEH